MSDFWAADPVVAPAKGGNFWDADPVVGNSDVSANNLARSAATGIPIVGGVLNKLDAATNAALAPVLNPLFDKKDQLNEPTFGERYEHSKRIQEGMDKSFESAHPILDTTAKLVGGVAATAPLMAAAPGAFGLTGTVPQMVAKGAASGAALNATDAAVRGENPIAAAETGGIIGGAAGPAGKLVGKAVSAIADRIRPPEAVPQNMARVGNTDIPLTESQVTGNPAASSEEQILLRGGRGEPAQNVAQKAQDLQEQRINQAKDEVGATLDPTGKSIAVTPQAAGEHVAGELGQSEQARQAVRALQDGSLGFERENIGAALDPTGKSVATTPDQAGEAISNAARRQAEAANAERARVNQELENQHLGLRNSLGGGSQIPVGSPHDAAELVSQAVRDAAEAARGRTGAAYDAMREMPGEFNPAGFRNAGQSIRQRISAGDSPVNVNNTTPFAQEALQTIDSQVSGARFPNAAEPNAPLVRQPNGSVGPAPRPITGTTVDEVRKQLVQLAGDAKAAASRTGVQSDVRAMRRIIQAFDNHVSGVVDAGGFSGDGPGFLQQLERARGLHTAYRQTFTSQAGRDKVGRAIEDIIGGRGVEPAAVPKVVQTIFGSESQPGGAQATQVAQRLRQIFGEHSPEWAAYKQGLFSHIAEGVNAREPGDIAKRINNFVGGTHGRSLSQVAFTPEERQALSAYANRSNAVHDVQNTARSAHDAVGKTLEKIVGEGGQPATPQGVADTLFGRSGIGDSETAAKLAKHVRDTYGPNSPEFSAVRQGMWHSITESPGGKLDLNPSKVADRIAEHVNGRGKSTADILFTPAERSKMLEHAGKLRASAPKEGDEIDKVIGRITGRDGGLPASPTEVADFLYGRSGAGDKGVSVKLAQRLKRQLSPEGFNAVRQGMWTKLTEPTEGRLDWGPQKIAERMHEFLNGNGSPLSHVLYTSEERGLMKKLAGVYKQMIPVKGTTNPSGTAPMLAKIAGGARHTLLPLLGFTHGGVPGAAVAYGMDKGLSALSNAKSARRATELFYGPQAKRPINPVYSKAARLIAQSALTQSNQQQSQP